LSCLLALTAQITAQTATSGQIAGTVHDPSGAAVAGARIVITAATGQTREAQSSREGYYRFSGIEPGEYSLRVTAKGFATYTAGGIGVGVTETADVSPQLQVGAATTNVQVTAEAPLVQTETASTGRVVEEREVHELPLPTRNYQQLLGLQPGTSIPLTNNIALGRGDVDINVNGQQATSNNVLIDGIQVNSIGTNSTPNIPAPSIDSVEEFIVQTSLYDSTQGRNTGGNVALVTKSGTNKLHGSVFEFFRNDAFNANDYFLKQQGQPRPELKKNQYGGTFGGPLVKDKTFLFLSYQGQREANGADPISSLSSLNIPSGLTSDRSTATLVAYANTLGLTGYYGAAGDYPWPLIDSWPTIIDPTALALLQAKLPNGQYAIPSAAAGQACSSAPYAIYSYTGAPATYCTVPTTISNRSTFDEIQFNTNADQYFGKSDHLAAKFFSSNSPSYQGIFSFLGANTNEAPGYGGEVNFRYRLLSLDETHVFSSSLLNDARLGFSRIHGVSAPTEPFTNSQFGIFNSLASSYPGLATIGETGNFTIGPAPLSDEKSVTESFMLTDMVTWNHGRHSMRIGADGLRHHIDFYFHAFTRGEEVVNDFGSFLLGGNDADAALGGLPGNIIGLLGNGVEDRGIRMWDSDYFAQEDFKATPHLTLNAGVRLNRFGGPSDIRGRMVNLLPSVFAANNSAGCATIPATASCTGTSAGFVEGGDPLYNNQFAADPRVGFSYQPPLGRNLTVRGGFGIYHDRVSSRIANLQIFNYPFDIVGVGFGDLEAPFPNLAGLTYPLAPTVPSAIPLYYYGGALAGTSTPISGYYVNPKFASPYVYQYSLSVQVEPAHNWLAELGFVGVKGVKLLDVLTLDQYNVAAPALGFGVAPFDGQFSTNKAFNGLELVTNSASSNYNSLQASLTKRMDKHLQLVASYTFGKSTDDYSGAPENELAAQPGNQDNPASQRGLSDYDRKQRLVLSGLIDEGKLYKGDSKLAQAALDDWQMASIMTFQTGTPYSVICVVGSALNSRADYATGTAAPKSANQVFNPNAYTCDFVTFATYMPPYGNTPRNFLRGPGQKNVDLSLFKNFPVTETSTVQFRAEFFNIGNWENFNNPNNNLAVFSTVATTPPLSASGPRVIQFALKYSF
jgi:hypothetical protein